MLNYEYPPLGGGAANATAYLLREFGAAGVEVDLVTSAIGRQTQLLNPYPGTRVLRLPTPVKDLHYQTSRALLSYTANVAVRLPMLLSNVHYDVIHAMFAVPSGFLAYLARRRSPFIVSLRGSDVPGFNPRFARLHRLLGPAYHRMFAAASAVVANSAGLRSLAHQSFPEVPIHVIPNGIDISAFTPAKSVLTAPPLRVICVARLIDRKRIGDVLDAIAILRSQRHDIMLDVVGTGPLAGTLESQARQLGIASYVTWHGYVDHERIAALYRQAHVLVLPSLQEGMSNTLLEALACGLAIVATDTGGAAELVDQNGAIVPACNPSAIATALSQIVDSGPLRQRYAHRSRAIAEKMSWAAVAHAYQRHYVDATRSTTRVTKRDQPRPVSAASQ